MPLSVQCPCGAKLRAPDAAAGKSLKCPKCGEGVPVPASAAQSAIPPNRDPTRKPAEPPRAADAAPPPPTAVGDERHPRERARTDDRPHRRDADGDTDNKPRRGSPIVALVVGGIALVGFGIVALAFGIYLVMPKVKPREERQGDEPAMAVVSDTTPAATAERSAPQKGGGVVLDKRVVSTEGDWEAGPVTVQVTGASIVDEDVMLIVAVKVADPKEKVTFRSWRDPLLGRAKVRLADNNGTVYHPKGYDLLADGLLAGAVKERFGGKLGIGTGPVYSNQPRGDVLLFEKPTPAAEYLDLDLDATHVGQRGTIRFRIPRSEWAPTPKTAPPAPMPTFQPKLKGRPGDK